MSSRGGLRKSGGSAHQSTEADGIGVWEIRALKPLERGQSRTKLFGLKLLQEICQIEGADFLAYRTYTSPEEFRLGDFPNPGSGRLIVRTDPVNPDNVQSGLDWLGMPRLNVTLDQQAKANERRVREFMSATIKEKGRTHFIVHKARNLAEYDRNVRVLFDLKDMDARVFATAIPQTGENAELFRDLEPKISDYKVSGDGELIPSPGCENPLNQKARRVLKAVIDYAKRTSHPRFDLSYVTYKGGPDKPEFYDLMFSRETVG